MISLLLLSIVCFADLAHGISTPLDLFWYPFEPQSNAPDQIVDSIGGLNGAREGASSNGTVLVRFLSSASGFCKFGSCITFWAFTVQATQNSVGRVLLPGGVDFPTFGGAIAFWLYMDTEISHNARLVSKFLPDGGASSATNSVFQLSLLENANRTFFANRTTMTPLGEEYNFFVFRFHLQFTDTSSKLVDGDRGEVAFQTHPFKQQWQHIVVSFSQNGLKLFRDGKLLETVDIKFASYSRNDSLPVTVGNSAAFNRAPAARLDELRFFGYASADQEITEASLVPVLQNARLPTITTSISTRFSPRSVIFRTTTTLVGTSETSVTDAIPTSTVATFAGNDSMAISTASGESSGVLTNDAPIIEEPEGRGKGAVIGGVIGGLLLVILLVSLLIWWTVRGKRKESERINSGFITTPPTAAAAAGAAEPYGFVEPTPAAATTVVGIYDHVPTQAAVISQQPLRNIYTKAPRSHGTQDSLATYGGAPDPSAFDVRSTDQIQQASGYTSAPSAHLMFN